MRFLLYILYYLFLCTLIFILLIFLSEIVAYILSELLDLPKFSVSLAIICLFIFFLFMKIYNISIKPMKLLFKGDYNQSLFIYKRLLRKNLILKLDINSRNQTIYNVANIYHRLGMFQDSIAWLEKINTKKINRSFKGFYYSLYAGNILFSSNNIELAEEYFQRAFTLIDFPIKYLSSCYLSVRKNNLEEAKIMLDEYLKQKNKTRNLSLGLTTIFIVDREFADIVEGYFLGCYYQATHDIEKAKANFVKAYSCSYDNFYTRKATEVLNQLN